ncbi:hypothetical protein [Spirosoma sp. KCTC 42546]|uniref:hypothetical protein n=1 Tax=Spirosoma sp. KCTC 42546 TaxID=2520506 RepID=UPI001FEFC82F|nr:hypothetical protein [Spirosoma sp. KCTC 42546]
MEQIAKQLGIDPDGETCMAMEEEPQQRAPGAEDFDPQVFSDMAKKMGIKYEY